MSGPRFIPDGEARLQAAIEQQVREQFQDELSAAAGYWERRAVEKQIAREVEKQIQRVASLQSLWNSQ